MKSQANDIHYIDTNGSCDVGDYIVQTTEYSGAEYQSPIILVWVNYKRTLNLHVGLRSNSSARVAR